MSSHVLCVSSFPFILYDFPIEFWNCSDSVLFIYFSFFIISENACHPFGVIICYNTNKLFWFINYIPRLHESGILILLNIDYCAASFEMGR